MERRSNEILFFNGQWRRWKTDAEYRQDLERSLNTNFFPGIKDRKVRWKILKMEAEIIMENLPEEIKALMRPVVKLLWSKTHDLKNSVELFDQLFKVESIREECLILIGTAFQFYQDKYNGEVTTKSRIDHVQI